MPDKIKTLGRKIAIYFQIPERYISDICEYVNKHFKGLEHVHFNVHYTNSNLADEEVKIDEEYEEKFYDLLQAFAKEKGISAEIYNPIKKLKFKDLKDGEIFIVFPSPGDNSGHGGYLGGHHMFQKTDNPQDDSDNNVLRLRDDVYSKFSDNMPVLLIK